MFKKNVPESPGRFFMVVYNVLSLWDVKYLTRIDFIRI